MANKSVPGDSQLSQFPRPETRPNPQQELALQVHINDDLQTFSSDPFGEFPSFKNSQFRGPANGQFPPALTGENAPPLPIIKSVSSPELGQYSNYAAYNSFGPRKFDPASLTSMNSWSTESSEDSAEARNGGVKTERNELTSNEKSHNFGPIEGTSSQLELCPHLASVFDPADYQVSLHSRSVPVLPSIGGDSWHNLLGNDAWKPAIAIPDQSNDMFSNKVFWGWLFPPAFAPRCNDANEAAPLTHQYQKGPEMREKAARRPSTEDQKATARPQKPLPRRFKLIGPVDILPSSVQCLNVILDYNGAHGYIYRTVINQNITNVASWPHDANEQMEMASELLWEPSQLLENEHVEGFQPHSQVYQEQSHVYQEQSRVYQQQAHIHREQSHIYREQSHIYREQSHVGTASEISKEGCSSSTPILCVSGALQRKVHFRDISLVANAVAYISYVELPKFNINNPYEPQYYRYEVDEHGTIISESKCGLCAFCPEIKFKLFKNSSYLSHMTLEHGVFANSFVIPEGLYYGTYRLTRAQDSHKTRLVKGIQCPVCFEVIEVACWKNKTNPLLSYFRHFKKLHLKLTKTFIRSTVDPVEVRSNAGTE